MTSLIMELTVIALIVGQHKQTTFYLFLNKLPMSWVEMHGIELFHVLLSYRLV